MNDYFLSRIMDYLRENKIQVDFEKQVCGEEYVLYLVTKNTNTSKRNKFKIKLKDMEIIKFMIETEGIENAFIW